MGVEQVIASPRTVGLQGLTTWIEGSFSGKGGAQIGHMPEVAGREAGTWPSEGLPDSHPPKLQMPSCPPEWGMGIQEVWQDGGSIGGLDGAEQVIPPD